MLKNFLQESFEELNQTYNYCVLRNYEGLPEFAGNDVDILIEPQNLKQIEEVFKAKAKLNNLHFLKSVSRFGYKGLYFFDLNVSEVILIDLFSSLQKRWRKYIDSSLVLENRMKFNGFYVIDPLHEIFSIALKEILTYGYIRDKYKGRFQEIDIDFEKIRHLAIKILSDAEVQILIEYLIDFQKDNSPDSINLSLKGKESFLNVFQYSCNFVKGKIINLLGVNPVVCLIGPDGVGKSTMSNALSNTVTGANLFSKSTVYHHRYEILPALNSILNINNENENKVIDESKTIGKAHPVWKNLIYLTYYSLDFFLGWVIVIKAKLRNEFIIFDRYYYDFFIQNHYSSLPNWIYKFFYWFLPKPNVGIFLYANPYQVVERKKELTIEEHLIQNEKCFYVMKNVFTKPIFLNCNGGLSVSKKKIKETITKLF
ncbi:hypothetical protein [Christiangramia sp. OXR-203]|uniref:hypothetical protein n=1 Tax=Christiangramia sp. OXR-203 TaxID=3100176 RepID=UPI002AC8A5EA|nr:hypothetical protein [Christiangramia sp. OXR-203]WPY98255.1 hypothetical protein T8I65_13875 [Christiangramia sp. OXR-203]